MAVEEWVRVHARRSPSWTSSETLCQQQNGYRFQYYIQTLLQKAYSFYFVDMPTGKRFRRFRIDFVWCVCVCVCVHIFRCFFFAQSPIFLLSFFPVLTSAHSRSLLTDKQTKEYCCCRIDIKVTIHSKTEIETSTKKKQYWNVLWLRLNCICVYCVDVFTNSFQ